MRIKILIIITCTLLSSMCWADEYILVMSKEDNVCQHMLKLYNDDLEKYGEIKYNQHEEFNAIKWEEKKYYMLRDGRKDYPNRPIYPNTTLQVCSYDINNDGKNEIVVKDTAYFRSILADYLYYFRNEDSGLFRDDEFDIKILSKATGKIGSGAGSHYELKELPQFLYRGIGDKEAKAYYSLGVYLFIQPFFFDGNYYIEIKDELPFHSEKIYSSKFLVILKYTNDNQTEDVCYFVKTTN